MTTSSNKNTKRLDFSDILSFCIIHRDRIFLNEIPLAFCMFQDVLDFIFLHIGSQTLPVLIESQLARTKTKQLVRKAANIKKSKKGE